MRNAERLYDTITMHDLERLKELAVREHEDFFKRNPHLKRAFYDSLIGICLCQGAASHFLNPKVGIKDFDIWHFYVEDNRSYFPYRAHKRIENGYKGKPIDFLKRAIPTHTYNANASEQTIMNYLFERNTKTKRLLLEKAIIGLFPANIYGKNHLERAEMKCGRRLTPGFAPPLLNLKWYCLENGRCHSVCKRLQTLGKTIKVKAKLYILQNITSPTVSSLYF
jgi:hypothetical protein